MEINIPKHDAPLYIDVICYECGRRLALSNANERDGRYYCDKCLDQIESKREKITR